MAEPKPVLDTRPQLQEPGTPRCEANGANGYRWCRRDARKRVEIVGGDGGVVIWRMCSHHFCGDDELVESPDYSLGDKEPCTTCGEGVAHVMTLVEAAAYEASIARGEREPERAYT